MSGGASLSSLASSLHLESIRVGALQSRFRVISLYLQETYTRLNQILWGEHNNNRNPIRDCKDGLRTINLGRAVSLVKDLTDIAEAKLEKFEEEGIPSLIESLVLLEEIIYPTKSLQTFNNSEPNVRMTDSLMGLPAATSLGIKGNPHTTSISTYSQASNTSGISLRVAPAVLEQYQIQGRNLNPGLYLVEPVNKKYREFSVFAEGRKPDLAAEYLLQPGDGVLNSFHFLKHDLHLLITSSDKSLVQQALSGSRTQKVLVVSPAAPGSGTNYQKHYEADILLPQSECRFLYLKPSISAQNAAENIPELRSRGVPAVTYFAAAL